MVDKDEYGTSPTGETKAINAKTLAEQLAEIKHSDVGIRFSELADVPNEYIESAGSFVKINDKILVNGGRVLNITSASEDLNKARENALSIIQKIDWDDGFYRRDIGWRAIKSKKI